MIALQRVNATFTLKDHTYRVLREAILEQDIYDRQTNLRLDEREMAAQLGVSRTPLREALTRLENEGFVEIIARKGVYMRRRNIEEVVEMIIVWAALESMAARLACERATDSEIAELRTIGMEYTPEKAEAKLSEYSEANIEFHRTIMNLSKCPTLLRIAEELFTHLQPVRRKAMRDSTRTNRSVVDHMKIIESLQVRDADRASELVRDHTLRLGEYIRRTWKYFNADSNG